MTSPPVDSGALAEAVALATLRGGPTVNEFLLDRAIRHALYVERLKANEVLSVLRLLSNGTWPQVYAVATRVLERERVFGPTRTLESTARLREMAAQIDATLASGFGAVASAHLGSLADIAVAEGAWQTATLRGALGQEVLRHVTRDAAGRVIVGAEWRRPSATLLRAIARTRPMRGKFVRDWYRDLEASARRTVREAITIGLTESESVPRIVARIRKAADVSRRHVEGVVRNAVTHVTVRARELTYAENVDLIEGVHWLSTLDLRTSETCISLEDRYGVGRAVLPIDSGPRPPAHQGGCRSTTIPKLRSWRQLGISLRDAPEGTRASMEGPVPNKVVVFDWLKGRSRTELEASLGVTKARWVREGKLTSGAQLTDALNRPLTVKQIQEKEGWG